MMCVRETKRLRVAQRFSAAVVVVACATGALAVACAPKPARVQPAQPSQTISYNLVEPIFRESCEHCHNEDKAKGGLLMTNFEALSAGGESGPAFLPGQSASSL